MRRLTPALDKDYAYDPRQHLAAAGGARSDLGWTYDGVGNRTSEALDTGLGSVTDIDAYPPGDNRLAEITFGAGRVTVLTQDSMGNVTRDNDGVSRRVAWLTRFFWYLVKLSLIGLFAFDWTRFNTVALTVTGGLDYIAGALVSSVGGSGAGASHFAAEFDNLIEAFATYLNAIGSNLAG